jgi:dolichol kinase
MFSIGYTLKRKLHVYRVTTRYEIQVFRKLYHMLCGLTFAFLYLHVVKTQTFALWLLGIGGGFVVAGDLLRLQSQSFNRFCLKLVAPIARREEFHTQSAMASFIISSFIAILVFPPAIASLSILLLALSDPAASIVGILFGKEKFSNGKSLQGSLACFVVAFVTILIFVSNQHLASTNFISIAFIGALATTIAELSLVKIDDNFSIPIIGGAATWLALILLG